MGFDVLDSFLFKVRQVVPPIEKEAILRVRDSAYSIHWLNFKLICFQGRHVVNKFD